MTNLKPEELNYCLKEGLAAISIPVLKLLFWYPAAPTDLVLVVYACMGKC
jgi:hypothetical protein